MAAFLSLLYFVCTFITEVSGNLRYDNIQQCLVSREKELKDCFVKCTRFHCIDKNDTKLLLHNCACRKSCNPFIDCCENSSSFKIRGDQLLLDVAKNDFKFSAMLLQFGECFHVQESFHSSFYIRLISVCQNNDSSLAERCHLSSSVENIHFSFLKNNTHITFKNMHCAMCHGYSIDDLISWKAQLKCKRNIFLDFGNPHELSKSCRIYQSPPDALSIPRYCDESENSTCSSNSTKNSALCQGYISPIRVKYLDQTYQFTKVIYCDYCASNSTDNVNCMGFKVRPSNNNPMESFLNINLMNLIFSFDNSRKLSNYIDTDSETCGPGQVRNLWSGQCVQLDCPLGYIVSEGFCINHVTLPAIQENTGEFIYVHFIINFPQNMSSEFFKKVGFLNKLDALNDSTGNVCSTFKLLDQQTVYGNCRLVYERSVFSYLLEMAEEMIRYSVSFNVSFQNYQSNDNLICEDGTISFSENATLYNEEMLVLTSDQNISFSLTNSRFIVNICEKGSRVKKVSFCVNRLLNCSTSIITYRNDSYRIDNHTIYLRNNTIPISHSQYKIIDSLLYICQDASTSQLRDVIVSFENVLSFSLLLISILSLACSIFLNVRMKITQNLYGRNFLSYCVSLLFAQMLLLFPMFLPAILCQYIAILGHYLWLCSFFCTSILAFDLARKFSFHTIMRIDNNSNDKVLFKKYLFVSWFSPFVVVVISVFMDTFSDSVILGYGKYNIGWITNLDGGIIFFAVPVFILLLFNIVCFGVVLYGIEATKRKAKSIRKSKKDRNRVCMYLRICLLLGLSWILSYIAMIVKQRWISIIYMVCNGSQGVFILAITLKSTHNVKRCLRKGNSSSRATNIKCITKSTHL